MKMALRCYQIMSWIVGLALLVLTYATIRDWVNHQSAMAKIVSPIHGLLYMAYLVTVVAVYAKFKPSMGRIVLMVCSGFVPFLAFFTEHYTVKKLRGQIPATERS
jgi:integral membrane protein